MVTRFTTHHHFLSVKDQCLYSTVHTLHGSTWHFAGFVSVKERLRDGHLETISNYTSFMNLVPGLTSECFKNFWDLGTSSVEKTQHYVIVHQLHVHFFLQQYVSMSRQWI